MATRHFLPWYLIVLGAAFLLPSAGQIVRLALERDDIWWTPRGTLVSLGESGDRVEIYVRGVLLQDLLDRQRLQVINEGTTAPIARADVGLRLNHWDRIRARRLPGLVVASIVAGAAGLVLLTGVVQLARSRGATPSA